MPGVREVTQSNSLPLNGNTWRWLVRTKPEAKQGELDNVSVFMATPGFIRTTGLELMEGRDFPVAAYRSYDPFKGDAPPSDVIVSAAFARKAWPGEDPLGKPLYMGKPGQSPAHVIGVVRHLLNAGLDPQYGNEFNIMLPTTTVPGGLYVIRTTTPQARDGVLRDAPKVLDRVDNQRIITAIHTLSDTVHDYFHDDRALIWLLLAVIGGLLALTALGVVGLSSFWVQQRVRQIGIRRAIGATRRDIVVYFLGENLLIVTLGIVLGSGAAVLLNLWLMAHYELPRMPLSVLPIGAVVLWLIGQAAALGPALRAAAVPPVVATRAG